MDNGTFTAAIIGLGLMGGSFAYALRGLRDCVRVGYDANNIVMKMALKAGAIDAAAASPEDAARCADIVLLCTSPQSIMDNILRCAPVMKRGAVLCDVCGVKEDIAAFAATQVPEGVHYIGLHPMAGKEVGGFLNADGGLFSGAGFIVVPPDGYDAGALKLVEELALYVGAGRVCVNSPREHDSIIGYTSDLMHIAAAALTAHYPQNMTLAHTAGAFRDVTRIANIDAELWTELLLGNADHILPHLDAYIETLKRARQALEEHDETRLGVLLEVAGDNKRRMQTL